MSKLQSLISEHIKLLSKALVASETLLKYSQNNDTNQVVFESENRDRLINLVAIAQDKIDQELLLLTKDDVTEDQRRLLTNWHSQTKNTIQEIQHYNREIVRILSKQKAITKSEIREVGKNKKTLRKYKSSNLKT